MQIIRRNFTLKVLALVLAVTGWAYFRFANNPALAAHFDQQLSVPIEAVNVPLGEVAHFDQKEALVTVDAKAGESPVKPDQIKVVIDLAGYTAGATNAGVRVIAPDVTVQSLSPASIPVTIEDIVQREVPIAIHYLDQRPSVVVGKIVTDPSNVTLRGGSNEIAQVTGVRIDVPIPQQTGPTDAMMRASAIDADGREVSGVEVSPNLVRVQALFVQGTGGKN